MYGLDINEWLRGDRNWCDFAELLDELPADKRYKAAMYEDEELAELSGEYEPPEPPDAPSFRDFNGLRYDMARLISLIETLIRITAGMSTSGVEPFVPIPAAERVQDEKEDNTVMDFVSRGLGEVV